MKPVNPFDPIGRNLRCQSDDTAPVVAALIGCIFIIGLVTASMFWTGA